jgi:hypothetical protein
MTKGTNEAAAMPVGAAALVGIPCTIAQRKTVVSQRAEHA